MELDARKTISTNLEALRSSCSKGEVDEEAAEKIEDLIGLLPESDERKKLLDVFLKELVEARQYVQGEDPNASIRESESIKFFSKFEFKFNSWFATVTNKTVLSNLSEQSIVAIMNKEKPKEPEQNVPKVAENEMEKIRTLIQSISNNCTNQL